MRPDIGAPICRIDPNCPGCGIEESTTWPLAQRVQSTVGMSPVPRAAATLTSALLLLVAPAARAQAPGAAPAAAPSAAPADAAPARSYAGAVLAVDAVSLGIIAAAVSARASEGSAMLTATGITGLVVGAPIVHLTRGNTRGALISLGLRVGLPYAGAMAGYQLGPTDVVCATDGDGCSSGSMSGLVVGALVGTGAAILIDARWLSHTRPARPARWSPTATLAPGGGSVGLAGAF